MGSLMAGWDSPIPDPKEVVYKRNKSFTRGQIDAYWECKKKTEEEHLKAISDLKDVPQENVYLDTEERFQRSKSLPATGARQSLQLSDHEKNLEKLEKTSDWWMRSSWAFLNEPPVTAMEGPSYKYASQYHVANFQNSEPGVSAA